MARILFIQNFHPNEANAIKISNIVAERLKALGHTVFIRKFRFAETGHGTVFRAGSGEKMHKSAKKILSMFFIKPYYRRKTSEWLRKIKPDFAFDFHCSERILLSRTGFYVEREADRYSSRVRGVEIGAEHKPLPKKHRKILNKGLDLLFKEKSSKVLEMKQDYLEKTTSWRKSARKKELNPERLAGGITGEIDNIAREMKPLRYRISMPRARPRELVMRKRVRK